MISVEVIKLGLSYNKMSSICLIVMQYTKNDKNDLILDNFPKQKNQILFAFPKSKTDKIWNFCFLKRG